MLTLLANILMFLGRGWTMTRGFLVTMGGVVTVVGGSPRPLEIADLRIAAISAFIGGIAEADIE